MGKKTLVEWAPWASLVVGVLTLWAAWALWQWAHAVSGLMAATNALCGAYGGIYGNCGMATDQMSLWVWLGLLVLVVEGVLYLLAFPGLRDHKKAGWKYLYWGALINLAYAVLSLFAGYGLGSFIGALIGSAIGLWLLFQVRGSYTAR